MKTNFLKMITLFVLVFNFCLLNNYELNNILFNKSELKYINSNQNKSLTYENYLGDFINKNFSINFAKDKTVSKDNLMVKITNILPKKIEIEGLDTSDYNINKVKFNVSAPKNTFYEYDSLVFCYILYAESHAERAIVLYSQKEIIQKKANNIIILPIVVTFSLVTIVVIFLCWPKIKKIILKNKKIKF